MGNAYSSKAPNSHRVPDPEVVFRLKVDYTGETAVNSLPQRWPVLPSVRCKFFQVNLWPTGQYFLRRLRFAIGNHAPVDGGRLFGNVSTFKSERHESCTTATSNTSRASNASLQICVSVSRCSVFLKGERSIGSTT